MAKKSKTFKEHMAQYHMAQMAFIVMYLAFCFKREIQIEILLGMIMFGVYFLVERGLNAVHASLQEELEENRNLIEAMSKPAAKKKTAAKKTTAKKKTAKKKK